jgi:hypothetical protein
LLHFAWPVVQTGRPAAQDSAHARRDFTVQKFGFDKSSSPSLSSPFVEVGWHE